MGTAGGWVRALRLQVEQPLLDRATPSALSPGPHYLQLAMHALCITYCLEPCLSLKLHKVGRELLCGCPPPSLQPAGKICLHQN